ncbi:MAG: hypothetical protein Q9160_004431 [Pyrenula sp. 1 TL-2023]
MAKFSMQQLLRRNILARNQALRRKRKQLAHAEKEAKQKILSEQVRLNRLVLDDIRDERKNRREDWLLGPLAPNRNAGLASGAYGAMNAERRQQPDVRRDVRYPHFLRDINNDPRAIISLQMPVPFSSIRLVARLPEDPNDPTSPTKEAIIRSMYGGPPFRERPYGTDLPAHTRYISGVHEEIPWPDVDPEYLSDEDADTTRYQVEERSYVPDITALPFPPEALNDIVNMRARNRLNYEREEIEKRVEEDVKKSWARRRKLRSPKEEQWEMREKERNEELKGLQISDETMKLIRETQAFNVGNGRKAESPQKMPTE